MRLAQAVWLSATVGAIAASATMSYHYMAGEGTGAQGQILELKRLACARARRA